ncbi:phosphotransferase family protein [Natronomonas sp. EA1]|uniref:phosphotransferase family protein n=1 Tax=Natronomonas sp. EA1 TaxID=3421655 RepID=UPI003EB9E3B5
MPTADPEFPALESHLRDVLGIDIERIETLSDGLNLVLEVTTPAERYILRRPNDLRQTGMFTDVATEYRVLDRLVATSLPAPEPIHLCEDPSLLGAPFTVTRYLPGETVPLGSDLPERFRTPAARERLAHRLVDTLATMHTLETAPFEGVCDQHTVADQVAHDRGRLDVVADATGEPFPRLRGVGEWLARNAPETGVRTLVHGDYRPGNVLFSGDSLPELTGVLDWETAMLGDPLGEVGYLLLRWRDEDDEPISLAPLEDAYPGHDALSTIRRANEAGLAPFTAKPGSPSREALVARYEARTGTAFEHERFYRANAAFMLGAVWADLHRLRVEAGAESEWKPWVSYMALIGEGIIDGG